MIHLQIPIDLLGMEVDPSVYSRVLYSSSVSKSARTFLYWSSSVCFHSSVLYHRYIDHSLYLVILSTFVKPSRWSGREQDNTLESERSPSQTWECGSPVDTFARILLSRHYSLRWGETTLLFHVRQVDTWSCRTQEQSVLGYTCWLVGLYTCVRTESDDLHDSVVGWEDYLGRILLSRVHR